MKFILCLVVFMVDTLSAKSQYWVPLGGGVQGSGIIGSLQVDTFHSILYVGGAFDSIGSIVAKDLAI